jgi:hypothetical protein
MSLTGSLATPRPASVGARLATCSRLTTVSTSAINKPFLDPADLRSANGPRRVRFNVVVAAGE